MVVASSTEPPGSSWAVESIFYEQIYDLDGEEVDQDIEKKVLTKVMQSLDKMHQVQPGLP